MRPDPSQKLKAAAPKQGPNPAVIGGIVAAVLIVGVVVAILIGNSTKAGGNDKATGSAQPLHAEAGTGGGILANTSPPKGGAPTLDLYADFQCPNCGKFESAMGPTMTAMAKAGDVKLVVHTLSFLDDYLKNDSSKRTANAAACASDAGKFLEYNSAAFAGQPAREGDGYTDAQLTEFATTAGISGAALTTWQQCSDSGQHDQYVADVQTAATKAGVNGTPTMKLNGQVVDLNTTPDALIAQVKAATK